MPNIVGKQILEITSIRFDRFGNEASQRLRKLPLAGLIRTSQLRRSRFRWLDWRVSLLVWMEVGSWLGRSWKEISTRNGGRFVVADSVGGEFVDSEVDWMHNDERTRKKRKSDGVFTFFVFSERVLFQLRISMEFSDSERSSSWIDSTW